MLGKSLFVRGSPELVKSLIAGAQIVVEPKSGSTFAEDVGYNQLLL